MRESIEDIRKRIEKIDREILRMMANRTAAAVEMGQMKAAESIPLRAPQVEEMVIGRYVERAKEFGMSAESARQIATLLIRESIEQQGHIPRPQMSKRILVVGGNGRMGMWLCRFFASRGHRIRIHDQGENPQFPVEKDLERGVRDAEVIVLATPISTTPGVLEQILAMQPAGLILDIASIKTPLVPLLRVGAGKGMKVCSLHPMFGPDTASIVDRNVIVCHCGSADAIEMANSLIDGANIIEMEVEDHDPLMAYVLGLSHAVNIAFFEALRQSGRSFEELNRASSTTFKHQVDSARNVASENAQLYYEIQHLNPFNKDALEYLQRAVDDLKDAAVKGDKDAFERMMEEGKEYFGGK
ncbi:MAG: prephenate dehydrogenase/arogenate dehydrogenase family protein [Methanomassiliicoccus sp.]|nr:prephenate dehydrogenase/arogenate dehydrogenase family protein [Methanomassiliicoccus sp.]